MTPVNWTHALHVGYMPGDEPKHFIAVRWDHVDLGKTINEEVYAVIEMDRDTLLWLIQALQDEITLAQRREN